TFTRTTNGTSRGSLAGFVRPPSCPARSCRSGHGRELAQLCLRDLGPEDLLQRPLEQLIAPGCDALARRSDLDVRHDADALRRPLVRVEHTDAGDHGPL